MAETKIFISYAHKDEEYFKLFKEGIEAHSKSSQKLKWKTWCDNDIPIGSLWHKVIQNEIKDCDAAILLVSAKFLSSAYIEYEEFVKFLKRSEENDFIFFPILLDDCDITQWDNLPNRQFFSPKGKEYDLPNSNDTIMPYSRLVRFNHTNGTILPNSYRETYHKNCVRAFEKIIVQKNPISDEDAKRKFYRDKAKEKEKIETALSKSIIDFISQNKYDINEKSCFLFHFIDVNGITNINSRHSYEVGNIVLNKIEELLNEWAKKQKSFPASYVKIYGDQYAIFSLHKKWKKSYTDYSISADDIHDTIRKYNWKSISENLWVSISSCFISYDFQKNDLRSIQMMKDESIKVEFVLNKYFLDKLMRGAISLCESVKVNEESWRGVTLSSCHFKGKSRAYNIPVPDMITITTYDTENWRISLS